MDDLFEVKWSPLIKAGEYAAKGFRRPYLKQHIDWDQITIKYDFNLAKMPVTEALFSQFVEETGYPRRIEARQAPEVEVQAVYCHDVTAFIQWFNEQMRAQALLGNAWVIDFATAQEWVVGMDRLYPDKQPVVYKTNSRIFIEWCWRDYFTPEQEAALNFANWHDVSTNLATCFINGHIRGIQFASPTWEERLGFRLVRRKMRVTA